MIMPFFAKDELIPAKKSGDPELGDLFGDNVYLGEIITYRGVPDIQLYTHDPYNQYCQSLTKEKIMSYLITNHTRGLDDWLTVNYPGEELLFIFVSLCLTSSLLRKFNTAGTPEKLFSQVVRAIFSSNTFYIEQDDFRRFKEQLTKDFLQDPFNNMFVTAPVSLRNRTILFLYNKDTEMLNIVLFHFLVYGISIISMIINSYVSAKVKGVSITTTIVVSAISITGIINNLINTECLFNGYVSLIVCLTVFCYRVYIFEKQRKEDEDYRMTTTTNSAGEIITIDSLSIVKAREQHFMLKNKIFEHKRQMNIWLDHNCIYRLFIDAPRRPTVIHDMNDYIPPQLEEFVRQIKKILGMTNDCTSINIEEPGTEDIDKMMGIKSKKVKKTKKQKLEETEAAIKEAAAVSGQLEINIRPLLKDGETLAQVRYRPIAEKEAFLTRLIGNECHRLGINGKYDAVMSSLLSEMVSNGDERVWGQYQYNSLTDVARMMEIKCRSYQQYKYIYDIFQKSKKFFGQGLQVNPNTGALIEGVSTQARTANTAKLGLKIGAIIITMLNILRTWIDYMVCMTPSAALLIYPGNPPESRIIGMISFVMMCIISWFTPLAINKIY